jgi:DNA-binding response OmpR family regulator
MNLESVAVLVISGRDPASQRLAYFLATQGMRVTAVADPVAGQLEARSRSYDCLVLDLGCDANAAAIMRMLRSQSGAPIIFIAATKNVTERVNALDAGADDCVALPFSERELMTRILATVRRARGFHPRA